MNERLVKVEGASFGYSRKAKAVVGNVELDAGTGDLIVFRGPNGCGKSTIIKGMLGIAYTVKGNVNWIIDKSGIGYVPQETTISGGVPFTVFDIVYCSVKLPRRQARERCISALAAVEMDSRTQVRFGDLSGGQKRRVLFARALVRDPRIMILDEPTANVDQHTEKVIVRLIDDIISKNEAAVIAVAHATDFAGKGRVIRVENGRCLHD